MPRLDYKTCRNCERPSSEVGELSHTRLCGLCAPIVQRAYNQPMHEHSGPVFREWRRKIAASVGAVLLDDLPRET